MKTALIRKASMASLHLKKHSPTILFGAGIVGMAGTVVLACKATLKAQDVVAEHKENIEHAANLLESGKGYDKETHKRHVTAIWTVSSKQYVKLYGPAFILGLASVACLTKSHQILSSRNSALTAAYMGLDRAFKGYRQRVANELGAEKEHDFFRPKEDVEIVEYDEKGNPVPTTIKRVPGPTSDILGRWFDEGNVHYDKDHGYNADFLDNQQKWANIKLKRDGFLFLNDVYKMLGMEKTAIGQSVGWWYENPDGDSYIDFGHQRYPEFMNGRENKVFLDFNVDGVILGFLGNDGWHQK